MYVYDYVYIYMYTYRYLYMYMYIHILTPQYFPSFPETHFSQGYPNSWMKRLVESLLNIRKSHGWFSSQMDGWLELFVLLKIYLIYLALSISSMDWFLQENLHRKPELSSHYFFYGAKPGSNFPQRKPIHGLQHFFWAQSSGKVRPSDSPPSNTAPPLAPPCRPWPRKCLPPFPGASPSVASMTDPTLHGDSNMEKKGDEQWEFLRARVVVSSKTMIYIIIYIVIYIYRVIYICIYIYNRYIIYVYIIDI